MDILQKTYVLSFIDDKFLKPVGVFDSKEAIYEAINVRFSFINEPLPIEGLNFKIDEFQFNLIDD